MKIITLVDRNEDFIDLQYKSLKKNIIGDFEYIVFNNGHSKEQVNKISNMCCLLNVKEII